MRTTANLDDELLEQVRDVVGPELSTSSMLNEVMRYFVQSQAARRLAALGGTMPYLVVPDRKRSIT